MKKSFKAICSLVLMLLMVMSLASTAFAVSPSITFHGFSRGFDFQPGSEYTETDLFGNFKNVMPGDTVTETITFTNSATDCDFVNLYMRAEAHDETENPLSTNKFANRVGEVDWMCHVEAYNESQLSVRKVWSDGNANRAHDSITVNLLKDGKVEASQALNAENGWAYTFDRLPEGHTWTVEETNVPANYTVSYSTVGTMTTITNTRNYTPPTPPTPPSPLDITVYKVWSSDDGKERPDSVTVTLYNGETAYDTVRLGAWNNWSYSWNDPNAYGNWQVIETNIPKGYVPSYSVSGNNVTITNTRSLIQTGQLNWPIWVLCGAGLALVALGVVLLVMKKKKNHA